MGQSLSKNQHRLTLAFLDSSAFSPDLLRSNLSLNARPKSTLNTNSPLASFPQNRSPPSPRPSQLRNDSGFDDSVDDAEDLKDLAYIDTKYYSELLTSINLSDDSDDYYEDDDDYEDEDEDKAESDEEEEGVVEGQDEAEAKAEAEDETETETEILSGNSRSQRHSMVLGESSRSQRHSMVLGESSRSQRQSMLADDDRRSRRQSMPVGGNLRSRRQSALISDRRRSWRQSLLLSERPHSQRNSLHLNERPRLQRQSMVVSERPRSQRQSILVSERPRSQRQSVLVSERPRSQRQSMLVSERPRSRRQSRLVSVLLDVDHIVDIADGAGLDPSWSRISLGDIADGRQIDLSGRLVRRISGNIRFITPLTNLVLSDNLITTLPPTIDALVNLTSINLSNNTIAVLPLELCSLPKLTELHLSHNQISSLPPAISGLTKLASFILDHNRITQLPQEIGCLKSLTTLDVSHNPLPDFPAELSRLPLLRRLHKDMCPTVTEFHHDLVHSPPSLLETCARLIVRQNIPLPPHLRQDMRTYLLSAKSCSFCGGPFFRSYVRRGRIVQRAEDVFLPLVYMLCSQHWNNETERVRIMFAGSSTTAPTPQKSVSMSASSSSSSSSSSSAQPSPLIPNDATAASQTPSSDRRRTFSGISCPSKSMAKGVNRLSTIFFPSRLSDGPADEAFAPGSALSPTALSTGVETRVTSKFREADEVRIGRWGYVEAGSNEA